MTKNVKLTTNIEQIAIERLIPYARNSRTHSETQIAQIAASMREFGFTNPVLISDDETIIAGHGRILAAQTLGLDRVPCLRLSHLTEAQRRAYVIADNKLALNAGWDDDLLKLELGDLGKSGVDLSLTGFSVEEMDGLFYEPDFAPGSEEDQGKLDELAPKMVACPHCGGEWDLREHGQG